jgi:hypothetical protein
MEISIEDALHRCERVYIGMPLSTCRPATSRFSTYEGKVEPQPKLPAPRKGSSALGLASDFSNAAAIANDIHSCTACYGDTTATAIDLGNGWFWRTFYRDQQDCVVWHAVYNMASGRNVVVASHQSPDRRGFSWEKDVVVVEDGGVADFIDRWRAENIIWYSSRLSPGAASRSSAPMTLTAEWLELALLKIYGGAPAPLADIDGRMRELETQLAE